MWNLNSLAILLLILFIISNFMMYNKLYQKNITEPFINLDIDESSKESDNQSNDNNQSKNKYIDDEINKKFQKIQQMILSNSSQFTGPVGPRGPAGPAGNKIITSGYLVNADGSYEDGIEKSNIFSPDFVVTRTSGTTPEMSLSYLDKPTSFVSYQNWMLTEDNFLKNRYDDTCLTINELDNKVFMSECNNKQPQQWRFDKNNRLVSLNKTNSGDTKCLSLSKEENITTTSLPNCKGDNCYNKKKKKYLIVKNCDTEKMSNNEIWNFI